MFAASAPIFVNSKIIPQVQMLSDPYFELDLVVKIYIAHVINRWSKCCQQIKTIYQLTRWTIEILTVRFGPKYGPGRMYSPYYHMVLLYLLVFLSFLLIS